MAKRRDYLAEARKHYEAARNANYDDSGAALEVQMGILAVMLYNAESKVADDALLNGLLREAVDHAGFQSQTQAKMAGVPVPVLPKGK